MIPVVLDNSITGMTGHQDNPGSGYTLQGDVAEAIRIEDVLQLLRAMQNVFIVDPQDLTAMQKAVDDALASTVPAAIIARRPCLLIKRIKHDTGQCVVDTDKCIGCKKCLKVGCPAVLHAGRQEPTSTRPCAWAAPSAPRSARWARFRERRTETMSEARVHSPGRRGRPGRHPDRQGAGRPA